MKCTVSYNQMVIESEVTAEQFENARSYQPTSVDLRDEKGKLLFCAMVKYSDEGSINENGIIFNGMTAEGKLFCSIVIGGADIPAAEKKTDVAKAFGPELAKLKTLENQIMQANAGLNEVIASVQDAITIA